MGLFSSTPEEKRKKLQKRLFKAIDKRNFAQFKAALDEGADPNGFSEGGGTPLYRAAARGFSGAVDELLSRQVDIDKRLPGSRTPLMAAFGEWQYEIAKRLISRGADVHATDSDGWTPLHYAARKGRGDIAKMLLEKGADVMALDSRMNTPADLTAKDYPGLANFLRSKMPAPQPEKSAGNASGWHLTAPEEIARVTVKEAIGYRVTEVFNFSSRVYTQITHNLSTRAESQAMKAFDEISGGGLIEEARRELLAHDGKIENDTAIDKPKLTRSGL